MHVFIGVNSNQDLVAIYAMWKNMYIVYDKRNV